MRANPAISVCVCTYRRPALLERLLAGLAAQQDLSGPFEVVVVDNDRECSAAAILVAGEARFPELGLRHASEPRQSIALARNRAVRLACGEWIAFIDDDEEPSPVWLASLYRTASSHGADGALGPVLPRFPHSAPSWVPRGRFFERPRHATGTPVPSGELRTSNLLIRRKTLIDGAPAEGPFDPRFGLSGGEDSDLLCRLARSGARFVWSDEAVVEETVPPTRTTLRYLLARSFGGGNNYARQCLLHHGSRALVPLLVRGSSAVAGGGLLAVAALPLGVHRAVRWGCVASAGVGKLVALTGRRFDRYAGP